MILNNLVLAFYGLFKLDLMYELYIDCLIAGERRDHADQQS